MQFKRPLHRRTAESVVPMINVVFLLLIFFMMSARIAPPPPFELTLPLAVQEGALSEDVTLYIARDGAVSVRGQNDEAAWEILRGFDPAQQLVIRADAEMPAPLLAKTLRELSALGLSDFVLAVRAP